MGVTAISPKTKEQEQKLTKIATKLKKELETILDNKELKAKERRSSKRKAEAIALEESGCNSIDELLTLLPTKEIEEETSNKDERNKKKKLNESKKNTSTTTDNNKLSSSK